MYIPRTQMTLVLLEKGLVLEGWPSKIEVIWALGIHKQVDSFCFLKKVHAHASCLVFQPLSSATCLGPPAAQRCRASPWFSKATATNGGKSEIWGGSWCGKPNEISWLKKRRALTWNLKIGGLSFCRCLFLFEGSFFSGFLAVKFSSEYPTWPVVPSSTFFWLVDTLGTGSSFVPNGGKLIDGNPYHPCIIFTYIWLFLMVKYGKDR